MQIIQDKRLLYFLGSYLGFYLFIVSVALDLSGFGLVFKLLTVGMFCIYIFIGNNEHTIDFQKTILLLFGVLLSTFMMVRGKMQDQYVIVNNVCVFVLLFVTVIYFIQNHKGLFLKNWIYKNSIILLIIFSFGLMSLEVIDSWLMWDAAIYYSHPYSNTDLQGIVSSFDANFAGIDGLYLAGHVSLGYSLWLILFQLFKEGSESVQIANIILAGISIFAYYQILRKIFSNRFSDKIISLATMPYAFSPFILGLVGNLNLDSATMYFFIIFIACSLYQFEILEWVLAFLLCFTKENAILYFAIYILMKVICEYRRDNLFQWTTFIKYSLRSLRNYIYALPLILWCLLKMLKPVWGGAILWSNDGMNCFGIDVGVITMKLKQIFLLNFNWIFWIIILGGGIVFAIRKTKINKEISTIVIPISAVCVMIIMFGCLYITWTHVRYILPLIPMLYLIATFIIAEFGQRVYFSLNILVSILLLIQNFYVIDPIMINAFDSISVGNGKVFDMKVSGSKRVASDKVFNDCIVYNRQYIYWGETLMNTLNKVGYDGNMLIVLPENVNCEEWLLVGTRNGNVLWNKQERKFEYYNELKEVPEQCVWLNTCHVSGMEQAYNGNDILYIIPRWADIDMEFVSDKNVISQGEIDNKGYNIQYMIMRVKNNLPLVNGSYKVAPKQDNGLNLHTNGGNGGQVFLQKNVAHISLEAIDSIVYHLNFGEYQVALDVPKGLIDGNGTVQVWSENGTSGQRWVVEEVGDYYMICFKGYALTYDLNDNSVKLCPKTGEDNQLWSFDS